MSQSIDQHTWDAFVLLNGPRSGAFLQSWAWGEFQKAAHHHIDRHVYEDRNGLVGIAQLSRRLIPVVGFYDYIARGPIVSDVSRLEEVMDGLSGVSAFVRFDATVDPTISLPKSRVEKTIDGQPARTVMNDLRLSEHALLEGMHAKTRYNIGLAEKKDLEIRVEGVTIEDVWHLFEETSNRGDFRLHEREYYETMLARLSSVLPLAKGELEGVCPPRVFLAAAFVNNKAIAATIMLDFGDTRTYLHGASSHEHRALMAPTLLHWHLMLDAKELGLNWYDWWGVSDASIKGHAWEGISRFKRGFGGEEVAYPGTYDVVMKGMNYGMYKVMRKIRRMM